MSSPDLSRLVPGFDHESSGSQAVFRAALEALSHPGRPIDMPRVASGPRQGHRAAALLLLSLLDADTGLWLSPSLAEGDASAWLRFHTGCRLVTEAAAAQFCWMGNHDWAHGLDTLNQGSDNWPDQSATCVIEVDGFEAAQPRWALQGPGIPGERQVRIEGLPAGFELQWQENHSRFPRGVDVFLASSDQILGMPRTVRLRSIEEA